MRKPSIFSKDYERKIRKRRRRIVIFSIVCVLILSVVLIKFTRKTVDFTNVRAGIQKWIDEDTQNSNIVEEIPQTVQPEVPIVQIVPEAKLMDFKVSDGKILKVEYEEVNGKIQLKTVKDIPAGIEYNISPSKELILVLDEKQNMQTMNTKGEVKNITKTSYKAPNGEVFNKDTVQTTYKDYLWHKTPKFINNEKIVYKTNMPYFGIDINQYLWVVNIDGNNESTLWQSKAKNITIGEIKEKGLEVIIDGNIKYINNDNNLIN